MSSAIAQLVEQKTVNLLVAGSSPARGASLNYILFESVSTCFLALSVYLFDVSFGWSGKDVLRTTAIDSARPKDSYETRVI